MFRDSHLTRALTTLLMVGTITAGNIQAAEVPIFRFKTQTISGPIPAPGGGTETGGGGANVAPAWSSPAAGSLGSYAQGAPVTTVPFVASDSDGPSGVSYTVSGTLPGGLNLVGNRIQGTVGAGVATGTYPFTVNASDGQASSPRGFSITVTAAACTPMGGSAPQLTTPSALGTVGTGRTVSQQLFTYDPNNDVDNTSFKVTSGGLPTGLALSPSGLISGTVDPAAEVRSYSFTVEVSDLNCNKGTRTYNMSVGNPPVFVTAADLGTFHPGEDVDVSAIATDPEGTAITYSFRGGSYGWGLDVDGNRLYGTVDSGISAGTYTLTIRATDATGLYTDGAFTYTLEEAAPAESVFTWETPSNFARFIANQNVGRSYELVFKATNPDNPSGSVSYSVVDYDDLPPGIWLNGDSFMGHIDPAATPGTYTFEIEARDDEDPSVYDTETFTIVVEAPPAAPSSILPDAYHGASADRPSWFHVSDQGSVQRGQDGYTYLYASEGSHFLIIAGSPPPGLANPGNEVQPSLHGTVDPGAPLGDYYWTYRAINLKGEYHDRTYKLTVTP